MEDVFDAVVEVALGALWITLGSLDITLAIPGTRVIVHITPQQQTSWAPHGIDAYYVGPSLEHYRCFKFFIPTTNATRDATTVD